MAVPDSVWVMCDRESARYKYVCDSVNGWKQHESLTMNFNKNIKYIINHIDILIR